MRSTTTSRSVLAALLALLLAPAIPAVADDTGPAAPVITLGSDITNPTNAGEIRFDIRFAEEPEGFRTADIAVVGSAGRAGSGSSRISSTWWAVWVRPARDGDMTLQILPGTWTVGGVPGPGAQSPTVRVDRTGPALGPVEDTVLTLGPGQTETTLVHDVVAADPTPPVTVSCTPASGATVGLGMHQVSCSASDGLGNTSSTDFYVTVVPPGERMVRTMTSRVELPDDGAASPYPATITVEEPGRVVRDVDVDLRLVHGRLDHLDLVLVGPRGQSVMLLSDIACDTAAFGALALRLDQSAPDALPASGPVSPGRYRPTNHDSACHRADDDLAGLAPGSWSESLDVFDGTLADGVWKLYAWDDTAGVGGYVDRWQLVLETEPAVAPSIAPVPGTTAPRGEPLSIAVPAGGNPAPTLSISAGTLPEGLRLEDGAITGTPTQSGTFPLTVTASNGYGAEASRDLTLTVTEPATITSPDSLTVAVGTPFSYEFTVSAHPAASLSLTPVSLPAGVELSGTTLQGTPTEPGTHTVHLTAVNDLGTDQQDFTLTVLQAPAGPSIARAAGQAEFTRGTDVAYTVTFAEPASGLSPDDFDLRGTAARGTPHLTGGPTVFTLTVPLTTDGTLEVALPDWSWQNTDGFNGLGANGPAVTLDRTAPVLPAAEPQVVQIPQGHSTVPVTVPLPEAVDTGSGIDTVSCTLAPGTSLSRGVHPVSCTAVDRAGNSTTVTVPVYVVPATEGLVTGVSPSSIVIPSIGAAHPFPATIEIDAPGRVITDVNVDMRLTHSFLSDVDMLLESPEGRAVMLLSDLGCDSEGTWDVTFDQQADSTVPTPMASGTYRPADGDDGCSSPNDTFPAGAPTVWTDSLDELNGTFAHGTWKLWVRDDTVLDGGSVAHWALQISTVPAVAPGLPGPARLELRAGEAVAQTIATTGVPRPRVSVTAGALPAGLSLVDGALVGTPTEPGEHHVTVTASNAVGADASQELTIVVVEPPRLTVTATAHGAVGTPFSLPLTASGYPAPTVRVDTATLPAGLRLEDGELRGTPLEAGDFSVVVTADNGHAPAAVQVLALSVREAPAAPVIARATGQGAATNRQPLEFTLTFAAPPTGLEASDLEVHGTAGGGLVHLTGGPLVWSATVTGLAEDGTVWLRVPFGSWSDAEGFLGAGADGPQVRLDTQAPQLLSPAPPSGVIVASAEPGRPGAHVSFEARVTGASVMGVRLLPLAVGDGPVLCSPASGSFFPIGSTPVECSSTDEAGNRGAVRFTVTVVDEEAPVIEGAEDVEVALVEGAETVAVHYEQPAARDNSGTVEVSCDTAPGTALGAGQHRVTCTAEDPSGNTAATSFTVTVLAAAGDGEEAEGGSGDREEGPGSEDEQLATTGGVHVLPGALAVVLLGVGVVLALRRREA